MRKPDEQDRITDGEIHEQLAAFVQDLRKEVEYLRRRRLRGVELLEGVIANLEGMML